MIRLNMKSGPYWLDLLDGVSVEVLPASATMMLEAHQEAAAELDVAVDDTLPVGYSVAYAKAVARRAILDWKGVEDDEGRAVAVTPEAVTAFIDMFPVFNAFRRKYVEQGREVREEGNGSPRSPKGTSGRARSTAKPASSSTAKPAKTARRGKSSR